MTLPMRRIQGRMPAPIVHANGRKKSPARMHAELKAHGAPEAGLPRSLRRLPVIV